MSAAGEDLKDQIRDHYAERAVAAVGGEAVLLLLRVARPSSPRTSSPAASTT